LLVFFGEAAGHCLDEMSQSPCESVGPGRPTCCDSRGLYDAVIGFLPDQLSNLLGPVRHALEKNNFMPDPNSARSVTMLEETMQPIYLLPAWNLSPALGWQSILA